MPFSKYIVKPCSEGNCKTSARQKMVSVAMPADSRREKIFDFVREVAVKYFRILPVRDYTQQNKA